jgi:tetratricopeptide (TPR) repeat protein
VAHLGRQSWHPETGQVLLKFEPDRAGQLHTLAAQQPASSSSPFQWFEHALELEKLDPETAMDSYRQVLRWQPQHLDAHLNLGRLLHEKGELRLAEGHYRAALAVDPESAICFYNLGVVLEDQSRQSEALEAYQKSISLDPHLRDAHYNLARLYDRRGQSESALRHLTTYRQLSR